MIDFTIQTAESYPSARTESTERRNPGLARGKERREIIATQRKKGPSANMVLSVLSDVSGFHVIFELRFIGALRRVL